MKKSKRVQLVTVEDALAAFIDTPPSKKKAEQKTLASSGETQALPFYKEPTFVDDCIKAVDNLTKREN